MRINLLVDSPGDQRSGYLNVDPVAPEGCGDGRTRGEPNDLSFAVDPAEAEEIVALDVLDYYPAHAADQVLSHWLSLLRRGGTLTLSVVDVREVARGILSGELSPEDVQELLHGRQERPWQFRKASYTLSQLSDVLQNRGHKILARRNQNYRAVVTCQRPLS